MAIIKQFFYAGSLRILNQLWFGDSAIDLFWPKALFFKEGTWFPKISIFFLLISCYVKVSPAPFFSKRSESVNVAREMAGRADYTKAYLDNTAFYADCSITPEYTQTFSARQITRSLFGTDLSHCQQAITIQGSLFPNRNPKAWLADYFGLPQDFDGSIRFNPRIQNFLIDFDCFIAPKNRACGLYLHIHAPLVHTRWKLHPCETSDKGIETDPAGYFSGNPVPNSNLLNYALDFFSEGNVPIAMTTNTSTTTGNPSLPAVVTFQPLTHSKWAKKSHAKTALSDIEVALGYTLWCDRNYCMSLSVRTSVPTGNKPDSLYLFEPLIGSGGYWKLGGGLAMQACLWECGDDDVFATWYLDAHIQHLFTTCQKRCFDLRSSGKSKEGVNSRYMLAQRLEPVPSDNPFPLQPANSTNVQFASEFTSVANLTASTVSVSIPVEADIATLVRYTNKRITYDLGYKFYARSCEKICFKRTCIPGALDGNTWALKGDSQVFGFTLANDQPVALAATQSKATIYSGVNQFVDNITTRQNSLNIDNPEDSTNAFDLVSALPQRSSNPVVCLTPQNLDLSGTKLQTHTLFAHVNYSWQECELYTPYLGIGFEIEYSSSSCNGGKNCYLSASNQWGIWLKTGLFYH